MSMEDISAALEQAKINLRGSNANKEQNIFETLDPSNNDAPVLASSQQHQHEQHEQSKSSYVLPQQQEEVNRSTHGVSSADPSTFTNDTLIRSTSQQHQNLIGGFQLETLNSLPAKQIQVGSMGNNVPFARYMENSPSYSYNHKLYRQADPRLICGLPSSSAQMSSARTANEPRDRTRNEYQTPSFLLNDTLMDQNENITMSSTANQEVQFHPADLVNAASSLNVNYMGSTCGISPTSCVDDVYKSTASGNTTENVRVSSSFHVAEIVGKQGVKIKKIRANTNTWIKTPARGQDPVFIISGRKEGVAKAKEEIQSAADKVTRLRELRERAGEDGLDGGVVGHSWLDGSEELSVRRVSVPSHSVGLVMGPRGNRIREIAEATQTHIRTPSRHREPVFEIRGKSANASVAELQIRAFLNEKQDDEYIKGLMTQLPIHEPGTPLEPVSAPSVFSDRGLGPQQQHNFTRLRPFTPQASYSTLANCSQMFADLHPTYQSSAAKATPRSLAPTRDQCLSPVSSVQYMQTSGQPYQHASLSPAHFHPRLSRMESRVVSSYQNISIPQSQSSPRNHSPMSLSPVRDFPVIGDFGDVRHYKNF